MSEVFKRYGIITHNNIQGTKSGDLFDFGHYYIEAGEGDSGLGARDAKWGYNPDYVSGLSQVDQFSPSIVDGPSLASNELAERLATGEATSADVLEFYQSYFHGVHFPHIADQENCFNLIQTLILP